MSVCSDNFEAFDKMVVAAFKRVCGGASASRIMETIVPINRFFQKFGKKHGIEIHAHKLRHSFASIAITNGADNASVSEVLGHADKATTLRVYSHADEESKRRTAGTVSAAVKQA